ncbi:MAG: hotdog fold domain-containing protein [Pseudomonadota bacterium]
MNNNNQNLRLWNRLNGTSIGRWLHARIVCWVAPYFRTIKPVFTKLAPGYVEVRFKNRRGVQNHLKSVHAIAMCNAAELVGGVCLDVSLDPKFRWIPVGMTVQYLKMAKTDLTARCQIDRFDWDEPGDVIMPVSVFDTQGVEVFHADITMRISERKPR